MEKSMARPRRIDLENLDGAVEEALQRVQHANELNAEECAAISGGLNLADLPILIGRIFKEFESK